MWLESGGEGVVVRVNLGGRQGPSHIGSRGQELELRPLVSREAFERL